LGVHLSAYEQQAALSSAGVVPPEMIDNLPLMMKVGAPGVAIQS